MHARLNIPDECADPETVYVVEGPGPDAGGVGTVHVRLVGEARAAANLVESFKAGAPVLPLEASDRYGAFFTVEVAAKVQVSLQLGQEGQYLLK